MVYNGLYICITYSLVRDFASLLCDWFNTQGDCCWHVSLFFVIFFCFLSYVKKWQKWYTDCTCTT
ncbi:MAG TPA: hypothetical protein DCY74_05970 [Clostridiales bacterium]|nr:hypothetical protein [Clostridiales bacterium]HBE13702.1 hypothetical protein [Clostridiales bacterium]HCG36367.1 hypothetical protein [Clostridiales bacterium]